MRKNLEEATMEALLNNLDEDKSESQGIIDSVLVVSDPKISEEDYEEVIDRAQEIVKDTPQGEIPFDDSYIGQFIQTCPICGASFVEDHLYSNEACPICGKESDAFLLIGKIEKKFEDDPESDNEEEINKDNKDDVLNNNEDNTLDNNENITTDQEQIIDDEEN